jgi:GT2 family glycosyltransferase
VHAGGVHIGIVIPAYNAARWIGDAIGSVTAQTHRDWSMVVVDDGSTDGTGGVVAGLADHRIRLVRQPNAGVSAARNRGAELLAGTAPSLAHSRVAEDGPDAVDAASAGTAEATAKGAARGTAADVAASTALPLPLREGGRGRGPVLFLDADDALAPDALSRLLSTLKSSPDAVAAVGAYTFADTRRIRPPPSGDLLPRLLIRNLFANGGHVLIRGEILQRAGGFLTDIAYGEDWEFWTRIALQGPFASVPGPPVLFVRQHVGSAYHRLATNPDAFAPCMAAIFANPALRARFGSAHLTAIQRRTEAENAWIIGRELIRHGRRFHGLMRLRRSFLAHPSAKRAVLVAAAHLLPLLPVRLHGPFRAYEISNV